MTRQLFKKGEAVYWKRVPVQILEDEDPEWITIWVKIDYRNKAFIRKDELIRSRP